MNRTVALYNSGAGQTVAIDDCDRQEGNSDSSDLPVLAFLTCIDGAEKGVDFPVLKGITSIGTVNGADICVKVKESIKNTLLVLTYDYKKNMFIIKQDKGDVVAYVNESPLISSVTLKARDIVEIENVKFIFVPFCEENRRWE